MDKKKRIDFRSMSRILLLFVGVLFFSVVDATTISTDNFECGNFNCGSGWNGAWSTSGDCIVTSLDVPIGSFHMRGQEDAAGTCVADRKFNNLLYATGNISFWVKANILEAGDFCRYYYDNGISFALLLEITDGGDDDTYREYSFDVTSYGLSSDAGIRMRQFGVGSDNCYIDDITILGFGSADSIPPTITVNSPQNNQFISVNSVVFNITLNENGTARYTLNGGLTNKTMSSLDNRNFNATNGSIADGQYTVRFYANDTNGNVNGTVARTFTIDTTKPLINIVRPQNISYSSIQTQLNYTVSDANLQSCWYSLDNGQANTTITCGTNISSLNSGQGSNTWRIYTNDSAGNVNSSSTTFFVDSIVPLISYSGGMENNNTIKSQNFIFINVSVIETNEANITFRLYNSTSLINSTSYTNGQRTMNFTNLADGTYFYYVTVRDILNNENTTERRTIILDRTPPSLSIIIPQNISYNNATLLVNISSNGNNVWFYNGTGNETYTSPVYRSFSEGANTIMAYANLWSCWYNIYNGTVFTISNTTLSGCSNSTFSLPGINNDYILTLFANDSLNNIKRISVNFTISLGAPTITLSYPLGNAYINSPFLTFNFTASDPTLLDSCELWGDFNGVFSRNRSNTTLVSGQQTSFPLSLLDGTYKWNILCNDSLGNIAITGNRTLVIDTMLPSLTIIEPVGAKTSRNDILLSFTASDANLQVCIYNGYRGINLEIANTSVSCNASSYFNVTVDSTFILNLYANDSAGNVNSSSASFSVDTSVPAPGPSGGGGSGGGGGGFPALSRNISGELKMDVIKPEPFSIRRGTSSDFEFYISNAERIFLNDCHLEIGGLFSSWIRNGQVKGLSGGGKFKFDLNVKVPNDIEPGDYPGSVSIKCEEGTKEG